MPGCSFQPLTVGPKKTALAPTSTAEGNLGEEADAFAELSKAMKEVVEAKAKLAAAAAAKPLQNGGLDQAKLNALLSMLGAGYASDTDSDTSDTNDDAETGATSGEDSSTASGDGSGGEDGAEDDDEESDDDSAEDDDEESDDDSAEDDDDSAETGSGEDDEDDEDSPEAVEEVEVVAPGGCAACGDGSASGGAGPDEDLVNDRVFNRPDMLHQLLLNLVAAHAEAGTLQT